MKSGFKSTSHYYCTLCAHPPPSNVARYSIEQNPGFSVLWFGIAFVAVHCHFKSTRALVLGSWQGGMYGRTNWQFVKNHDEIKCSQVDCIVRLQVFLKSVRNMSHLALRQRPAGAKRVPRSYWIHGHVIMVFKIIWISTTDFGCWPGPWQSLAIAAAVGGRWWSIAVTWRSVHAFRWPCHESLWV